MAKGAASGAELVALARDRLASEIHALDGLESYRRRAVLIGQDGASRGALVHYIRQALDDQRDSDAHELFVPLVERTAGLTRQWTRRTILTAGLALNAADWQAHAADLSQELTLRLWEAIAHGVEPAWELFFGRALAFAQGHIADAWLRRVRPRLAGLPIVPPVSLTLGQNDEGAGAEVAAPDASARFGVAELADLRALVARLPERERLAVALRYWVGANEATIARSLGGVSTRTVRNTLTRAYAMLRVWYAGDTPAPPPANGPAGE